MTQQEAKQIVDNIEVIKAFSEGKTVQYRIKSAPKLGWIDAEHPSWNACLNDYRIKPTPTLRPWKPEEVPVGARIRKKGTKSCSLITSHSDYDFSGICGDHIERCEFNVAVNYHEYSLDHGVSWRPCGVEESV